MAASRPAAACSTGSCASSRAASRRPASAAGLSIHAWLDRLASEVPAGIRGAGAAALFPRREDAAAGSPCPRHARSASACITASPISGGRRWRASSSASATISRSSRERGLGVTAGLRLRRRGGERPLAADRRRCHRPAGAAHRPASRLLPGRRLCRRPWRGVAARFRRHLALCRPAAGSSSRSPPIARSMTAPIRIIARPMSG